MTATDGLRQAAQTIRETAQATYDNAPHAWYGPGDLVNELETASDAPVSDAAHIALWSPSVALAIADWLEDIAADKDSGLACIHPRALDVTNLILGSDQ